MGKEKVRWLDTPEDHNYPAAASYLTLLFEEDDAVKIVDRLEEAEISHFKAKDIFRASKLSLLGVSNSHVEKNIEKIEDEDELSPILLVRDIKNRLVIIADGYHRMCAIYHYDEDVLIPCKIVNA